MTSRRWLCDVSAMIIASLGLSARAVAQQPPPPPSADLRAGGLAPPPPMSSHAPEQPSTEAVLEQSKHDDAGRGLEWAWLFAQGGVSHQSLTAFGSSDAELFGGLAKASAFGSTIAIGAGVRALFFTLGPTVQLGVFDAWSSLNVGGDLGWHVPLGNLEPHVALGAGYASIRHFGSGLRDVADAMKISGGYARLSGGLEYYVTPVFSVGGVVAWQILRTTRAALKDADVGPIAANAGAANNLLVEKSALGSDVSLSARLALHF